MRNVFKHPLQINDEVQIFCLPAESTVVHCGEQDGVLFIWVDGCIEGEYCDYAYRVIGTGHPIEPEDGADHVGTVQMTNGLVWHIYEI